MFKYLPKKYLKLLLFLLGLDALIVLFHLFYRVPQFETLLPFFQNDIFSLAKDASIGEIWQYVKELSLVAIFVALVWRGFWGYVSWASLFVYFFVDDLWRLHEAAGHWLAEFLHVQPMFYVRARDLGELIFFTVIGLMYLIFIILTYYQAEISVKIIYKIFFVLLVLLVFFGVVLDTATIFVYRYTESVILTNLFELMEEGGEMVVLSLFAWLAYNLFREKSKLDF